MSFLRYRYIVKKTKKGGILLYVHAEWEYWYYPSKILADCVKLPDPTTKIWLWLFLFLLPFFLNFTFLSLPTNACYWIYHFYIIKGIYTDIDVWSNWKQLTEAILVAKKDDAATDEIMTTTQTITAGGGKLLGYFVQSW